MSYYIGLYIIVAVLMMIASKYGNQSKWCIIGSAVLIFLFFAFRIGFTPDYYDYEGDFVYGYGTSNERFYKEPLYIFLTKNLDYRIALILQAALFCICFSIAFIKFIDRKYYLVSVSVLFWYICFMLGCFSGFRSSFVTVALFLSIIIKEYFHNQKIAFILGLAMLVAASNIHQSGWLVLPLLLFGGNPLPKWGYKLLVSLSIVLIVISLFFANTLNSWVSLFVANYVDDFSYYMQDYIANTMYFSIPNLVSLASKAILFFITVSFVRTDYGRLNNIFLLFTSLFFLLLLMPSIGLISRYQYYFLFPTLIGVSIVLKELNEKSVKWVYFGALFVYGFFNIYNFTQAEYSKLFLIYDNLLFN